MSLTWEEAYDLTLDQFKTAWDLTGYPVAWPNVKATPPMDETPWARPNVTNNDLLSESLASGDGVRRYQRGGFLAVQIFVPLGGGLSQAHSLAKIVADAFEGKRANGVWFSRGRVNEIGQTGDWYQVNFICEFQFTEVK